MVLCRNICGVYQIFLNILCVKEPTLKCGYGLIIDDYIVFLLECLSLFISGCCLANIYHKTTSNLIAMHVIILKCLISSVKETYFVEMCLSNMIYDMKFNCLTFAVFKWLSEFGLQERHLHQGSN